MYITNIIKSLNTNQWLLILNLQHVFVEYYYDQVI